MTNLTQNIGFQNSHWSSPNLKTFAFKRDIFKKIWQDLDTKLMALITGPRRVGKSVLLKQIMSELITYKKVDAKQIFFYEFAPRDKRETIWDSFYYYIKEIADPQKRIYLFFDEIQYIAGYESEIKNIYDNAENCKIFLTGSLSLSYKRRMEESLAGRFFSYKLFPLNFLEFIKLHKKDLQSVFEEAKKETDRFKREGLLTILNVEFRKFLENGRYPENFGLIENQNKLYLTNILDQSLNQDAYSYFGIEKPSVINSIFSHIRQNNGGILSINKLSNQLGVAKNTVSSYLDILELTGLTYFVYNSTNPLIKPQSAKKAYVNSSFALLETKLDLSTAYGLAVESYILERLLEMGETVTFYRNRNKEIDFLLPKKGMGYEVKFRSDPPEPKFKLKDYSIETISLLGPTPACLF